MFNVVAIDRDILFHIIENNEVRTSNVFIKKGIIKPAAFLVGALSSSELHCTLIKSLAFKKLNRLRE